MKKFFYFNVCLLCSLFLFFSCSSAPKNRGDIYVIRIQTEEGLESANREAGKGSFEFALTLLTNLKRNAIMVDDSSLIIRVCLSRGNVLYSLGDTNGAFAEWERALEEALKLGNSELLSVSRIFLARGNLVSGRVTPSSVLEETVRESANIKSNRLYIAFSWQVRGLALRSLGLYREAEDAIKRSLDIHTKARQLENASYDWYTIASVRSLAGNYSGAISALEMSVEIDRRIENSWGLAASYRAMGDVYRKDGNERSAQEAYRRAAEIFAAMGNEREFAEINNRIRN